jgi:hypothetical protein
MIEEHVHGLPQRVIEDLDHFLMNEGVAINYADCIVSDITGERKGLSAAGSGHSERWCDIRICSVKIKPDDDVVGPGQRRQIGTIARRDVTRRQRPFADDDGVYEFNGDMLCIRDCIADPESKETPAAGESSCHVAACAGQTVGFTSEESARHLVASPHAFRHERLCGRHCVSFAA